MYVTQIYSVFSGDDQQADLLAMLLIAINQVNIRQFELINMSLLLNCNGSRSFNWIIVMM
jgi:hypothetical protein